MAENSRTASLVLANERSLAARLWTQGNYRFRSVSVHHSDNHSFKASYPYYGWVDVCVGDINVTMYSNDDDGVAMIYHAFGPDSYESATLSAWVNIAKTATSVADIGSFTGLFALLAHGAAPNASIIAVEPNSAVRARLSMNLVANRSYPAVTVAPYAVADAVKTLPLHIAWGLEVLDSGSSLASPKNAPAWLPLRTEIVTAASVDTLMRQHGFERLDLIKMDIEGLEDVAISGSIATLQSKPTLFIEIQDQEKFSLCYDVLSKLGYEMIAIDDESIDMYPYDGGPVTAYFEKYIQTRVINYLCVSRPEHKALAFAGVARIKSMLG